MNDILREHINKICVVYLDDILLFSTSLEEHIHSLGKNFSILQEDRQDIIRHLEIIEGNTHNAIGNINKQILINEHFNDSINLMKTIIAKDRIKILKELNRIQKAN